MDEYLKFIEATEAALTALKALKTLGWDARAISIAVTHIETAQLWATNATPEEMRL